jgi:hypothetical protein
VRVLSFGCPGVDGQRFLAEVAMTGYPLKMDLSSSRRPSFIRVAVGEITTIEDSVMGDQTKQMTETELKQMSLVPFQGGKNGSVNTSARHCRNSSLNWLTLICQPAQRRGFGQ